ncbi:hypothetical protein [Geobacter pickeringii]|uniref:BON domain-containing protein n=1 Tax=Geobacter pickeringii TaxID=345632 RepID=A0A0B5BB87_9BACT|nr:hypothetical protein [Geobacter pickeringii]AJE04043.1 hypothetical protein GPICK_12350 [Geobacter pickeringii]
MVALRRYYRGVVTGVLLTGALLAAGGAGAEEGASVVTLTRSVQQEVVSGPGIPARARAKGLAGMLAANSDGDVSMVLRGGVTVDVSYNDYLPQEVPKEQLRRITRQIDPLVNGVAVKVAIPF